MAQRTGKSTKAGIGIQVHAQKCANPFHNKWPKVPEEVELKCCGFLKSIFSPYKDCLRAIKKKPKWKVTGTEEVDKLTADEQQQRQKLRSQIVIGMSSLLRCLQSDRVRLVLLAKDTEPAVLKTSLLQLVQRHGCLGASIGGLHAAVKEAWPSVSSLTALGVLKSDTVSDFDDLVEYVRSHAPEVGHIDEATHSGSKPAGQLPTLSKGSNSDNHLLKHTAKGDNLDNVKLEVKGSEKIVKEPAAATDPVSSSKYYIYKADTGFGAGNFISFSSTENMVSSEVSVGDGESRIVEDSTVSVRTYGIKPMVQLCASGKGTSGHVQGTKRKCEGREDGRPAKSAYQGLNVKQMKSSQVKQRKANKKARKEKKKGK